MITILFELTNRKYRQRKKKAPWNVTVQGLLNFPTNSIGEVLGKFLHSNGFDLLEKSEQHDVFHVLTGFGIDVPNEMAMQFYLFGNGKRSIYLTGVVGVAWMIYPDYWRLFYTSYKRGRSAKPFHHLFYEELLTKNINQHKQQYHIL